MRARAGYRRSLPARRWHAGAVLLAATATLGAVEWAWTRALFHGAGTATPPAQAAMLLALALVPALSGAGVTAWAGGLALGRRLFLAAVAGAAVGAASAAVGCVWLRLLTPVQAGLGAWQGWEFFVIGAWRTFVFALLAVVGAATTEINLPEPGAPAGGSTGR